MTHQLASTHRTGNLITNEKKHVVLPGDAVSVADVAAVAALATVAVVVASAAKNRAKQTRWLWWGVKKEQAAAVVVNDGATVLILTNNRPFTQPNFASYMY